MNWARATKKHPQTKKRFEVHTWQALCRCGLNQLYKRSNIQMKRLDTFIFICCLGFPPLFFFWCLDCCLNHCEIEVMNAWWTSNPMHLDDLMAGVGVHSDLFWSMTLLCTPSICDAARPKHCKPVLLAFATPQPHCYFVLFCVCLFYRCLYLSMIVSVSIKLNI